MPGTTVFHKTLAGHTEVRVSAKGLDPPTRRVLIMVDGQRDTATLQRVLGSHHSIAETLLRLEQAGLIERFTLPPVAEGGMLGRFFKKSGQASSRLGPEDQGRAALARQLITDSFGPDGDSLCTRVEDCRDSDALEACLLSTATLMQSARGKGAAERFRSALGLPSATGSA